VTTDDFSRELGAAILIGQNSGQRCSLPRGDSYLPSYDLLKPRYGGKEYTGTSHHTFIKAGD
jgi:hypothetical protein